MANTSRRSYPVDDDPAATSDFNVTGSYNRRASKRGRYSFGSKFRPKAKISQPCLGFEDENLKPVLRTSLHLDERFFPYGIQPGNILEIKGPEKSGKTFLFTYFIARVLVVYPEKKVLLIDSRHKFSVKNFVSILCHFDKSLNSNLGRTHEERQKKLSSPLPTLYEEFPKILSYLDRIHVLRCYIPEDLMLIFGPPNESVVQNLLLKDANFCLVAVDSIDNYSYSESMQTSWAQQWPNIMQTLRNSVSSTRCPVICTSLIPAEKHAYHAKPAPSQRASTGSKGSPLIPNRSQGPSNNSPTTTVTNASGSVKTRSQPKEKAGDYKRISNFTVDYTVFTNILELNPVPEAEKKKLVHPNVKKITHCVVAYLRSRHNANTAGSGGNHRVKFSIFSDMLWVV